MGKALQDWLNANGLPAIAAAVLAVIVALALLLVVGGYWIVS